MSTAHFWQISVALNFLALVLIAFISEGGLHWLALLGAIVAFVVLVLYLRRKEN